MDLDQLRSPGALARRIKLGSLGPLPDLPFNLRALSQAGVIRPIRPDKLARVGRQLRRWGASPAAGISAAAVTTPERTMAEPISNQTPSSAARAFSPRTAGSAPSSGRCCP